MKKLINIITIILILILIYSLYNIGVWIYENNQTKTTLEEIKEYVEIPSNEEEDITIDFNSLKNINSDTIGYLIVNNTNINYPVVQTTNNDYYLNKSFDKTNNQAGWIFLDYKNNINEINNNLVIYGHNRQDNSMFGSLNDTLNKEWYSNKDNQKITFITENTYYEYEIFSIYTITNEEYYITTEFQNNQFQKFLTTIKNRSINNFNSNLEETTQILTLSTCYANDKERLVVHAKLINEKQI